MKINCSHDLSYYNSNVIVESLEERNVLREAPAYRDRAMIDERDLG